MTMVRVTNPQGVPAPISRYSNLSVATVPGAEILTVAGQVGYRADGTLAGDDVISQGRQTFVNIRTILASEGASCADIIRFSTFLIDADHIPEFFRLRDDLFPELFPDGAYPPNTLLVVSRLVRAELVIEIEASAVRLRS